MMKTYIATFYSHFAAMTFSRFLKQNKIEATLMPVPREVSSSCGTCVKYICEDGQVYTDVEDLETIFYIEDNKLVEVSRSNDE